MTRILRGVYWRESNVVLRMFQSGDAKELSRRPQPCEKAANLSRPKLSSLVMATTPALDTNKHIRRTGEKYVDLEQENEHT